nr:glucosyltransferase domain-containing protein [Lachnospiraceae bacterium]
MKAPWETVNLIKKNMDPATTASLAGAFAAGLLTHMSVMVSDIPNHDGLASVYSNQDLLTSGRWFLQFACGISSYYALPWLIGVLSLIYIAVASAFTVKILDIRRPLYAALAGVILAVFPALASDFAYVFTMDGYMLGMLLSVIAVYLVGRGKWGFVLGGVLLSLSVGTYQAYLAVAMILCLYKAIGVLFDKEDKKALRIAKYPCMGAIGLVLYYAVLKVLLAVRHTSLADYQGIGGEGAGTGIITRLTGAYRDFAVFTLKSKIMAAGPAAKTTYFLLTAGALVLLV